MNLSNNWGKSSAVRIPLFAALVYAYFCAPVSLERKAFVQPITASAPHNSFADGYDPRRDMYYEGHRWVPCRDVD